MTRATGLPSTSVSVIPLREAVRSGSFTRMYCAIFLVSLPVTLPYAYLASSAVSKWFELGQAMTLISILGIGSIMGRLVIALTADRFGRRQMFLMCCVGLSLATLIWAEWRRCRLSRVLPSPLASSMAGSLPSFRHSPLTILVATTQPV